MLVWHGRARQAARGRAGRAWRAAQGAWAAGAAPALHQLLQPRLPARVGSDRDPGKGSGVAPAKAARGAGRPDLGRRCGPPPRAPKSHPGARGREPARATGRRGGGRHPEGVRHGSARRRRRRNGQTALEPAGRGVDGAVATLLGILHEAQLTGHWPRLKGCRQCGYAFFDRSKNRSAAWCAMSICGNRTKNRAYYRRRTSPG